MVESNKTCCNALAKVLDNKLLASVDKQDVIKRKDGIFIWLNDYRFDIVDCSHCKIFFQTTRGLFNGVREITDFVAQNK